VNRQLSYKNRVAVQGKKGIAQDNDTEKGRISPDWNRNKSPSVSVGNLSEPRVNVEPGGTLG